MMTGVLYYARPMKIRKSCTKYGTLKKWWNKLRTHFFFLSQESKSQWMIQSTVDWVHVYMHTSSILIYLKIAMSLCTRSLQSSVLNKHRWSPCVVKCLLRKEAYDHEVITCSVKKLTNNLHLLRSGIKQHSQNRISEREEFIYYSIFQIFGKK